MTVRDPPADLLRAYEISKQISPRNSRPKRVQVQVPHHVSDAKFHRINAYLQDLKEIDPAWQGMRVRLRRGKSLSISGQPASVLPGRLLAEIKALIREPLPAPKEIT